MADKDYMKRDFTEMISDLTKETEELDKKIKELGNITDKEDLPEDELELIDQQEKAMKNYSDTLMARIEYYKATQADQ